MRLKNIKPASLALMLLALGSFSSCIHYSGQSGSDKLSSLLYVIGHQYVDTVDMDELVEKTIPKVLSELDPHSVYIPAKDAEESNQELRGSFSGIGIQFMIQSDTIYVSNIIPGGPAEKVGLMAGDRIVTIDEGFQIAVQDLPGDFVDIFQTERTAVAGDRVQFKLNDLPGCAAEFRAVAANHHRLPGAFKRGSEIDAPQRAAQDIVALLRK